MSNGFIKNQNLLEEKISGIDYLEFSSSVDALSEKINTIENNFIMGIVGPFGVGKSTLISKLEEARFSKKENWIKFDAWQFPERKELWEGLILETARKQGILEKTLEGILGNSKDDLKTLIETVADIPIPGLSMIKNFNHFVKTSPATRVFQLQSIFSELINNMSEDNIFFVLEDIDRSGESGLFFLETLSQFLKNTKLRKNIVVIVAISNKSYFSEIDVYSKCLDFVEFFNKKAGSKLSKFIYDVFETEEETDKEILIDFFNYIFSEYEELNMRKLKLILRQANLNFVELKRKGYNPNSLICIAVASSRYIKAMPADKDSFFDTYVKRGLITNGSAISRMIYISNRSFGSRNTGVLIANDDNILGESFNIEFVKSSDDDKMRQIQSIPYMVVNYFEKDKEDKIFLGDFYFRDL